MQNLLAIVNSLDKNLVDMGARVVELENDDSGWKDALHHVESGCHKADHTLNEKTGKLAERLLKLADKVSSSGSSRGI